MSYTSHTMRVTKGTPPLKTLKAADLERYILSALSPQERLEAALQLARQAFGDSSLTTDEIEAAIRKVRRKVRAERYQSPRRR